MADEWKSVDQALAYLARANGIPYRAEGEAAFLDEVSPYRRRLLDLGTGDGRLMALLLVRCSEAEGVAVDFSPTMLERAREGFRGNDRVRIVEHDLAETLPEVDPRGNDLRRLRFFSSIGS